jgi:hypothetical protein
MDNDLISKEEEKDVLLAMATILKKNCEKYSDCNDCPLYGRYNSYVGYVCPISEGDNLGEWAIN